MNNEKLQRQWYPLLLEKQLKNKPIARILLGHKVVLLRFHDEVVCFADRCPHRHVPLSKGKVVGNTLRCCYHGWSFNQQGVCVENASSVKKYAVHCADGIIWLRLAGQTPFHNYFAMDKYFASRWAVKTLQADFIHAIENFLDPFHTPYVHKGLLRNKSPQRMQIQQQSSAQTFSTQYQLVDKQNGWINRLFDPGIDKNIADFHYPGFARIHYLQGEQCLFQVAIFFVPIQQGQVQMTIKVSVRKTFIPSTLKFCLLKPFLELAFYQDKKILALQHQVSSEQSYVLNENDLVIDHLLHIFKGKEKGKDKNKLLHL